MSTAPTSTTADAAAPGLRRVGQIAVVVRDLARATRFYRETLGLPLLFEAPPGLAFLDCGGVRLMLSAPEGADAPGTSSIVYYEVDDIHRAHEALAARGARFEQTPHVVARLGPNDLWMAFLRDSEENLLGIMSEVPR